jgi:hypothetical protein
MLFFDEDFLRTWPIARAAGRRCELSTHGDIPDMQQSGNQTSANNAALDVLV